MFRGSTTVLDSSRHEAVRFFEQIAPGHRSSMERDLSPSDVGIQMLNKKSRVV